MEPFMIRRAKSFAYVLDNKKIFIDEDSVLAGHLASRLHGTPLYPDMTACSSKNILFHIYLTLR